MEVLPLKFPDETTLLITFGTVLVCYAFFAKFYLQRKDPPGPWPLPVFGNMLLLLDRKAHSSLTKLSRKYGPIFTFYFGPRKTVVLAGHKMIKQALIQPAFSAREVPRIIEDVDLTYGVVFANGASWKEMRHFALTNMRDFGMGKKASEEKIIEESQCLMELIKEKNGNAFDPAEPVNNAVSNIICSIVYGNRFEYDDPVFKFTVETATLISKLVGSARLQLYNNFPKLFSWIRVRKEVMENMAANKKHMTELIKGLQDTLDPQMCRGVVDSFLARKMQLEASGNMDSHFNEDNLLALVHNLFSAGTDSTSSTIRYGLLLMAKYPTIQDRFQEELNRVVGSRQVRMEDRKSLPYVDAVVHEIQRISDTVPITLHVTSCDVTFQNYFIKKGTPVIILLSSALRDENEWETPYTFNPSHFLDKEGNFKKSDAFIPFSAGTRACAGESLARMEMFLFFTSLLQNFRFTPPPGVSEDELDLTQVVGVTLTPSPHKLCAVRRF